MRVFFPTDDGKGFTRMKQDLLGRSIVTSVSGMVFVVDERSPSSGTLPSPLGVGVGCDIVLFSVCWMPSMDGCPWVAVHGWRGFACARCSMLEYVSFHLRPIHSCKEDSAREKSGSSVPPPLGFQFLCHWLQ